MNSAAIAGLLSVVSLISAFGHAESFDKPLHKKVLDLGHSLYLMQSDNRHLTVTCWYYTHFMIKERNEPGLKGAELLAIAPVQVGNLPKCAKSLQPGEKEFTEWNEEYKKFVGWNGYFGGVKRDLVFLERPDGDGDGAIPFAVFKPDANSQIFNDSVTLEAQGKRELNFVSATQDQIILRYLRVASAGCSIPKLGESCWSKLQQQTGLTQFAMPKCTDYEGQEAGKAASVIAYQVETKLYPQPSTRPLGGPIRCYPQQ